MGNSPATIFKHYRELVKPREAAAYWNIRPALADNIPAITRKIAKPALPKLRSASHFPGKKVLLRARIYACFGARTHQFSLCRKLSAD